MLRSMSELIGYHIAATDGDLGKSHDFLFDDLQWTVRYLVVDTGAWLPGRKVILPPRVLGEPDWEQRKFPVSLTCNQIEESPSIHADRPVSKQQEIELGQYYLWVPQGSGVTAPYPLPSAVAVPPNPRLNAPEGDAHLRSVRQVTGYHIEATDGDTGHIEDFIVEEGTWVIRYVVADTRNWLPGKKVLLSPWWLKNFDWAGRTAMADVTGEDIKNAPGYDPTAPVNREYEAHVYDFYGRPKYWE